MSPHPFVKKGIDADYYCPKEVIKKNAKKT